MGAGSAEAAVTFQNIPGGISFAVGNKKVEMRVASAHAFCLRVGSAREGKKTPSIYRAHQPQGAIHFKVVADAKTVCLQAGFGQLLVDPAKQAWTLRDASGATLADWAPLATLNAPGPGGAGEVHFAAGGSSAQPHPLYYGSGTLPELGALTQSFGPARVSNGVAGLPQYWSSAGYGALVVGQNDNAPGSWKSNAAGGIDWTVPGRAADLYLTPARDLYEWLRNDAELTGFAPVPPLWTFGYLQSRWGWVDKSYLDDTLAHFRRDQLPVDAFIIDFEWYTTHPDYQVKPGGDADFVDFGWNPKLFPDPAAQLAGFAREGLHVVGIRKPRLGNRATLAMAHAKGWLLPPDAHDPNNAAAVRARDLDYAQAEVRAWWDGHNRKFLEAGMAGFWNDEGEATYTDYSYWNLGEVALFHEVDPQARFWSINRSFIPGLQRFGAAVWTGDILSDWRTLAKTPGELLSDGLSGMPYSACDIGGFFGPPTPELLTRWMQAGIFYPIMRSHSVNINTPHFPWLYGPEAEAAIRQALDLRYRLLPYYYSLAHETQQTGAPLMRPLVMEFPGDPAAAGLTDEWLMGRGLLAAPIFQPGGARTVYLPNDSWSVFGTSQITSGPQTIHVTAKLDEVPVYVRAGTLLPLGPVIQYTGQPSSSPLEMQIYPGRDATFELVQDDGKSLAYQQGIVRIVRFSWSDAARTLSWKITGDYHGANVFHAMKAVLESPAGRVDKTAALDADGSLAF
jgi:alpha-glucosidase